MAFKFVKGSDVTITVQIIDKSSKLPYKLENFSSATGYLEKTDDSYLALTGALVSEDLGKLSFQVSRANTDLLQAGDAVDMEVAVDQSGTRSIFVIEGKIEIKEKLV